MSATSIYAGKLLPAALCIDIPSLITAYYAEIPDPSNPAERVAFGTSGHRGSSLKRSFNESHILAITQAICLHRAQHGIDGPLFLGMDTHALSAPARATVIEVLAANGVEIRLSHHDEYTPSPVISHAIISYNLGRRNGRADGIVMTPSHNPPGDGGLKYNPAKGGPADPLATAWIERRANQFLESKLRGVKRFTLERALTSATTRRHDYASHYIEDLRNVVNMERIAHSKLRLGVDPLGGAGVHYWGRIAETYQLDMKVVDDQVDPTFRFMPADWDGQIRMDPSSSFAMQRLIQMRHAFDLSFACDTDHDRHGIVTQSEGLLPPNRYLAVAMDYLFRNRPAWTVRSAIGKTAVSSQIIDRVAARLGRRLFEVPVGFKWFVDGLLDGSLAFAGEESAGATFSRLNGSVWTSDKDGIVMGLLAAEITASTGSDPGSLYHVIAGKLGASWYERTDAPATPLQKQKLSAIRSDQLDRSTLGGDPIQEVRTQAPGNQAPLGGVKVVTENGWFAARPSGTEAIYKIYAESFVSALHLNKIQSEAHQILNAFLGMPAPSTFSAPSYLGQAENLELQPLPSTLIYSHED